MTSSSSQPPDRSLQQKQHVPIGLQRHVSDRSNDRKRHYSYYQQRPMISSEVKRESNSTDYPVASKWRGSGPDVRLGSGQQHLNKSLTDISHHDLYMLRKKSSATSLDRHSFSGESQSSYSGSLSESNRLLPPDLRYHTGLINSRGSGTSEGSHSDVSDHQMRRNTSKSSNYSLPRSRSAMTTPLSSIHNHEYTTGRVWPVEEEQDGRAYHRRTMNHTDDYVMPFHVPSHYFPQSPTSPTYGSDIEQQQQIIPWYEEENPQIHTGFFFPTGRKNHKPPSHHQTVPHDDHMMSYEYLSGPPRGYNQTPGSYNRTSGDYDRTPIVYDWTSGNYDQTPKLRGYDRTPGSYDHTPGDNHQSLQSPTDDRVFDYSEQEMLSRQRLEHFFNQDATHSKSEHSNRNVNTEDTHIPQQGDFRNFSDSNLQPTINSTEDEVRKKSSKTMSGFSRLVKKIGGNRKTKGDIDEIENSRFERTKKSRSMENLAQGEVHYTATPTGSPAFGSKFSKGFLRARQNSESDLETALGSLFRSGSKKNLLIDATEALFDAIENQDISQCQSLLEEQDIDLNARNEDDLNPLDLAVMLNDSIAFLLLQYGAKDSLKYFKDPRFREKHLLNLKKQADREWRAIGEILSPTTNTKEMEKQMLKWRVKSQFFDKLLRNLRKASPPGTPRDVSLIVSSDRSLTVRFSEPEVTNGAVATRYKIEWSKEEHFTPEVGEFIMCDLRNKEYTIPDLDKGQKYFVRVSAFNMKGFGSPKAAPSYAIPSSWHDCNNTQPRFQGCTIQMEIILAEMNQAFSVQQHETVTAPGTPIANSRRSIKKGFTRLFHQGVKFSKNLKSGVYLASVIYSVEGRVLVTVDDNLPIIEISDSHPSSIGTDFAWLAKVGCTWENIKEMCEISDSFTSSPAIQFRNHLLHAIIAMQIATGQSNLGLVHHRPYQDTHGTTIFVLVQFIEDYKGFQVSNIKWSSVAKLQRKYPLIDNIETGNMESLANTNALELLICDVSNIIHHHVQCSNRLPKGLYLGYLKARLSLASMTVVTSSTLPNVFPHYKIRTNPNISREEWIWLQSLASMDKEVTTSYIDFGNQSLQKNLLPAIEHFLEILNINPEEVEKHQLYIEEVIELNENVTFLLITPEPEHVCTPPGGRDQFDGQYFSHMPISTFELLQLYTYQCNFITNFTMVSSRLDIELLVSQKRMRDAFSKAEISLAKKRHEQLLKFHEKTECVWKQMRWIEIAVQTARNSSNEMRVTIRQLKNKVKVIKRISSSSSSSMTNSSSSAGTLSPSRKLLSSGITPRHITVYPGYETGLPKGIGVKIYVTPSTTSLEVIKFTVEQVEEEQRLRGKQERHIQDRELKDFYLVAILSHSHEESVLHFGFTPLQLLNYSMKYKFVVRRCSVDQYTTDV